MRTRRLWVGFLVGALVAWSQVGWPQAQRLSLHFSGHLTTSGTCLSSDGAVLRCRVQEGSKVVVSLTATVNPARTVRIAAASLPTGWPAMAPALGLGTASAEYPFTLPQGSAGRTVELLFRAWADGISPMELRVLLEITSPAASACPAPSRSLASGASPTAQATPLLPWSPSRPLTWEDFWAAPPPDAPSRRGIATIHMILGYRLESGARYEQASHQWVARPAALVVTHAMDRAQSWVLPEGRTQAALNHEQGHFDLQEVYRRLLEAALLSLTGTGSTAHEAGQHLLAQAEAVFQRVKAVNDRVQSQYDRDTDHGRHASAQAEWDQKIKAWLLDPRLAPQP